MNLDTYVNDLKEPKILNYVKYNKYGYQVLGLRINVTDHTYKVYEPCTMPIGKYMKRSRKFIENQIQELKDLGYKEEVTENV